MTPAKRRIRIAALLGLLGGLVAVQMFLREPESTPLWQSLFDSGHAPLYGVFAWGVLWLLDAMWPYQQRFQRYLLAFAIAFAAGAIMEALQFLGPRQPHLADLFRNAAGIAAFLALAASFDGDLLPPTSRGRLSARLGLWIAALSTLALAFLQVALAGGAIMARTHTFPSLCDFETVWERQLVLVNENAEIEFTEPPRSWQREEDDLVGYVTFRPGRYSLFLLYDPYPDWTAYDALTFTVYSKLAEPVSLRLWIADDHHVMGNPGSFRRRISIEPGENRFRVLLSDVRETDQERELDMTRINKVGIYGSRIESSFSLFFDDFRLE